MAEPKWGIGIDIGGTKIDIACVDGEGKIVQRKKFPTHVERGPEPIQKEIVSTIQDLQGLMGTQATAVGVGMAGQILPATGIVKFAPNLGWKNVPLQSNLSSALNKPVVVTNDVRAAAWGEWIYGSGQGCKDLLCLFIGTGIGGGIVTDGRMMIGANNTAGELGHTVIEINGLECTCGNRGCLETLAAGWGVAKQAKASIQEDLNKGAAILKLANGRIENVTTFNVLEAAKAGDPLAYQLVENVIEALIMASVSFVNAFNPSRLILGGGLGLALPNLVERVEHGVKQKALSSATEDFKVMAASLSNPGIVGAAILALRLGS